MPFASVVEQRGEDGGIDGMVGGKDGGGGEGETK